MLAARLLPAWRPFLLPIARRKEEASRLAAYTNWTSVLLLPTLHSLWELLPPFLLAVPKKKVSHSRKAMRAANKGLKDKTNIVNCPGCGSAKLAHHICATCYSSISREWKAHQRSAKGL